MFVRAYLRASTADQDATRARESLELFADNHDQRIAAAYVENASGASSERAELRRLLDDAQEGDILLVEAIDRLSRLPGSEWERLRSEIEGKGFGSLHWICRPAMQRSPATRRTNSPPGCWTRSTG